MPRPNLKLNLNFASLRDMPNVPPPVSPGAATLTTLQNEEATLRATMSLMARAQFAPAHDTPTYAELQVFMPGAVLHGFEIQPAYFEDAFIHAKRLGERSNSDYAGDKIHLSVDPEAIGAAVRAVAPLLFSADNPINKWKITDLARCTPGARTFVGTQFTLYATTSEKTRYSAEHLNRIRTLINDLEDALRSAGIMQGERPASDVWPSHWHYASYRNEKRSGREGGAEQNARLQAEPFFKLIALR